MEHKSVGISFNIAFDDEVIKRCPKTSFLHKTKQRTKELLTLDQIEKKQLLAERRRQERIEARLKRMREREEATKKLDESVQVLLQQQSLRTGELNSYSKVPKMSQQEIMKTANDVVQRFQKMQQQLLGNDLKIHDTKSEITVKKTSCKPRTVTLNNGKGSISNTIPTTVADMRAQSNRVAFEIPVDEVKKLKTKESVVTMKEKNLRTGRRLTVDELNEKQQRAAERRQKKMEEKVRKTREGREALMGLQAKINIYHQHQEAMKAGNAEKTLSEQGAACLAQEIADGFSNISSRYKTPLGNAEGFFMCY